MFAAMMGVKVKTLQNWEQRRRNPIVTGENFKGVTGKGRVKVEE
jgi:hypothetical protein